MAAAGRASPSGTLDVSSKGVPPAPRLFPCCWGCPSEARQTPEGVQRWCNSWQVHSLSSSSPPPPPQSSTVHTKNVPSGVQCKQMQKEGPAAGPKLGVWVGSCLIPGEHSQNGKMVILGDRHCLRGCSGPFWEGHSPQSSALRHTSVWEFVLMWREVQWRKPVARSAQT